VILKYEKDKFSKNLTKNISGFKHSSSTRTLDIKIQDVSKIQSSEATDLKPNMDIAGKEADDNS
jgi:hypothetical protein